MPDVATRFQAGGPSAIDQQFQAWQRTLPTDQYDAVAQLGPYWSTLNDTQKAAVLKDLQHQYSVGGNLQQIVQKMIAQAAKPSSPSGTPAPPIQQAGSPAAAQQSALQGAAAPNLQLPEYTTNDPTGVPVAGPTGSIGGFNEQLSNFYNQEFQTAGDDPTQLAQLSGMTPESLQSQYSAYQVGWQKALREFGPGFAGGTLGGRQSETGPTTGPMSLNQFAQNKAQTMVGPWGALMSAIGDVWQSQMNEALPPELAQSIISALNGMSPDQKKNVLFAAMTYMENMTQDPTGRSLRDQGGALATAMLQQLPTDILSYTPGAGFATGTFSSSGTGASGGGIVGQWAVNHPSPFIQEEQIQTEISSAFESAFNRPPTSADLAALGQNPTPAQIQTYIDNQAMPGYPGMTYGAYNAVSKSLTTADWAGIFGRPPTPAQLAFFVGKDQTEVQDYINSSMSKVPGVTIGRYDDYLNYVQSLDSASTTGNHAFSSGVDDSLMSQLHSAVTKAATGKATPAPMTP